VRLGSEEVASSMLHAAPLLRKSTDEYISQSIYINPDLSPAAAKLAFEARKLRRTSRQQRALASGTNSTNETGTTRPRQSGVDQRGNTPENGSVESATWTAHTNCVFTAASQAAETSNAMNGLKLNQQANPPGSMDNTSFR
jgi:hypothetical protein